MTPDMELVRAFVDKQSEGAFEALVSRHVKMVYSTALRQVRDCHLAEEITQAVFIILARKAASLKSRGTLSGWLYRTACFVSADALKSQRRRQIYEQEAHMETIQAENAPEPIWEQISPLLDRAMAQLREKERDAILLRFFENKTLREVGEVLGLEERTAQKRIYRAVEKLRTYLSKSGVVSTSTIFTGLILANSVHAAPSALANTISIAARGKGAVVGSSTLVMVKNTLKMMAWAKAKIGFAIGMATLTASISTILVAEKIIDSNREEFFWREENLYALPPLLIVRPSSLKFEKNYRRNGEKFRGVKEPVTILLEAAYDFSPDRIVFSQEMPSGNFDFLATVPHAQEALQSEIQKQLKLVGKPSTRMSNCLLLRLKERNAPGVKPGNGLNYVRQKLSKGEVELTSCSFADLSRVLGAIVGKPVLDRTEIEGSFNISLRWNPQDKSVDSINNDLFKQLGLELTPSSEAIDVLVVENVRP